MKKILLIQLLRLGDVLMTLELIRGLREGQPDSYIALLGCSLYAAPLSGLLPIDELLLINRPALASLLLGDDKPIERAYDELLGLIRRIRGANFDLVVNLSHCDISALLAYSAGAKEAIGLVYDAKGSRRLKGAWAKYLFSLVKSRGFNALHISDIYKRIAGIKRQGRSQSSLAGLQASCRFVDAKDQKVVGLQLGASMEAKMWPLKYFSAFADMMVEDCGAKIVIFGSAREAALAEALCRSMRNKARNLAGKTSIPELARELRSCGLLVTNNTGTMHLAAAVGTKILSISLGSTSVFETGPRGAGHAILEPDLPCMPCADAKCCPDWKCRDAVTPEAVCLIARQLLFKGEAAEIFNCGSLKGLNVYRSEVDELGEMVYVCENENGIGLKELLSLLYRGFWSAELLPSDAEENILSWVERCTKGAYLQCPSAELLRCYEVFRSLSALFSSGSALASSILRLKGMNKIDRHRLLELSSKIEELDADILGFDPLTSPLKSMYEIEVLNIEEEDLFEIARQRRQIFLNYSRRSSKMALLVMGILSRIGFDPPLDPLFSPAK